ncbi:MAG TPA: hypothetical protein VK886_02460 [Vicinamibacterales bacterium]|nr:hypothetical protein [Vicinamibacterales bacterium]
MRPTRSYSRAPVITPRRVAWVAANIAAAVLLPMAFAWWLHGQVSGSEETLPEGFSTRTLVAAVTAAWLFFLLMLNVSMAVFLWLKKNGV